MNKLEQEVLGSYFDHLSQRSQYVIQELQLLQKQLKEIKYQINVRDEITVTQPQFTQKKPDNLASQGRNNQPSDLIRIKEVLAMTGVSRSFIYHHRKSGDFPNPIHLSSRSVAWVRSSVEDWIKSKIT